MRFWTGILNTLAVAALLAGCASSSTEQKTDKDGAALLEKDESSSGDSPGKAAATSNGSGAKASESDKSASNSQLYQEMSEALKRQDDERLQKAAYAVLGQNPSDARALNALGMLNFKKGRVSLAKFYISKAIAAHPNQGELYGNLGVILAQEGEQREAIQSFKKAIELNSADGIAAANVGTIYAMHKDYKKAALALDVAYRKGVRDYRLMNDYGMALVATGQADKAKSVYEDALKEQSSNRELLLNYAIVLIDHLQKFKEGLDVIDRLRFVGVGPESRARVVALENKAKLGLK